MVDDFYFWYCVEVVIICDEDTDALADVTDLDADILQEGAACPTSHDHDFFLGTLWPDRLPWRTLTVWSG